MDIMNLLPEGRYNDVDDLLAFISIYDDQQRTKVYFKLLEDNREDIKAKVCVELGCGLGLMSEKMAQLGARRIYAVEMNPYLYELARSRLSCYKNVTVVRADAQDFVPPEPVYTLVHEFYGQMLYDEELYILENLKWKPRLVLPDGGRLMAGLTWVDYFEDEVVNSQMLKYLEDVLVSGLFDEEDLELWIDVAQFRYGQKFPGAFEVDLAGEKGDLLYMGLKITHQGQEVCQAGVCDNWSYVWTWRNKNRFRLSFVPGERAPEVVFDWIN